MLTLTIEVIGLQAVATCSSSCQAGRVEPPLSLSSAVLVCLSAVSWPRQSLWSVLWWRGFLAYHWSCRGGQCMSDARGSHLSCMASTRSEQNDKNHTIDTPRQIKDYITLSQLRVLVQRYAMSSNVLTTGIASVSILG